MRVSTTILLLSLCWTFTNGQGVLSSIYLLQPELLVAKSPTKTLNLDASKAKETSITMEEFKSQAMLRQKRENGITRELQFDEKGYVAFYPNLVLETVIKSNNGTTLYLSDEFIAACDPNVALEISLEEFLTPDAIIKSSVSTYSKGQLLRSAGMARLHIKGTNFQEGETQAFKLVLPIKEVEGIQPYINKEQVELSDIDWEAMPDSVMEYNESLGAYEIQVEGVEDGMLSINCDIAIDQKPYVLKVKNHVKSKELSPSVVYKDGTITNLQLIKEEGKKNAKTQYFLFPAVHDQELVIRDSYKDEDNQSSTLNKRIKLEKNKLKKAKLKKLSKSGLIVLNEVIRYEGV